jgi:hypothetical protein
MLYSIIPPIIVVLCLVGIIIFFVKKAPQIALLEDGEKRDEQEFAKKKGFLGKMFSSSDGAEKSSLKHGFLFFLEKFIRRLRVFFLKMENLFTYWSENLKKKRKDRIELNDNAIVSPGAPVKIERESDVADRLKRYEETRNVYPEGVREMRAGGEKMKSEERIVRPMLSEKMVVPSSKPEIKNRLERILIERIAANPKDIEAYERLGEYYFEIENFEHSKECFKQVIKLDPTNASVKDKMRKLERLLMRR